MNKNNIMITFLALLVCTTLVFSGCSKNNDEESASPSKNTEAGQQKGSGSAFSKIYYYNSDNDERYADFKKKNDGLSDEDIVWMVNVNLDKKAYKNPEPIQNSDNPIVIKDGQLKLSVESPEDEVVLEGQQYAFEIDHLQDASDPYVLVNKYFRLPSDYEPKDLTDLGNGITMTADAADAYKEMESAAKSAGIQYIPQSGYRSYERQKTIYEGNKASDPDNVDDYSAKPGYSEHQTGLAIDVNIPEGGGLRNFIGTEQAQWVYENAHKYGFIVRYTEENKDITKYMSEPWHLRYIGKEMATKMKQEGIDTYEEFKVKFIDSSEG